MDVRKLSPVKDLQSDYISLSHEQQVALLCELAKTAAKLAQTKSELDESGRVVDVMQASSQRANLELKAEKLASKEVKKKK